MRDREWSLTYPGTSLTWGPHDLPVSNATWPDLGDPGLRLDDVDRPRGDGVLFGADYRGGRTIAFELVMRADTEAAVRDVAADVEAAWRGDVVRQTPGAVAELRARYAGRERVIYGRPRRCAVDYRFASQGVVSAVADFATTGDCWFGSTVQSVTAALAAGSGGGLLAPLSAPLTSTSTSDRSVAAIVAGRLPAWPVITIQGPVTTPVVELVGLWRIELRTTLAYDQSAVIDTRPWVLSVLRSGGGSLAGAVSPHSSRLTDMSIPPGTWEVAFRGVDETGTSTASITWQETHPGL
ncbi:hypothetical protein [Micromonospora sp. NPDC049204]|uniref:hypothetical protein n=1 Tax=Micromonospora sp. NPDC049204 TaxID=3154351 RepID=UPI0033C7CA96